LQPACVLRKRAGRRRRGRRNRHHYRRRRWRVYQPGALPSRKTLEQVTVRASDNVDRVRRVRPAPHWRRGRGLCEYGMGSRGTMLRHWRIGAVVAAIMVGLVMVGLGLATASPSLAPRYWLWLVPVFGLLSVLTAWIGSPDGPGLGLRAVGRPAPHWVAVWGG